MSSAAWSDSRPLSYDARGPAIASCAIFLAYFGLRLAVQYLNAGTVYLEDDAYYYLVIARNIAESGVSTFDGQTLTNGYHPLWLLILVGQTALFGQSIYLTIAIEIALATAGLWLFIGSFRNSSVLFRLAFAVAFTLLAWPMVAKGMEISLLIFSLGLFTRLALHHAEGANNAVALGLATALCIGARIDSAVFVLPMLVLASGSIRRAIPALAIVAVAGALYAGANLWLFGLPFPVSGAIKSLGGLQINGALTGQIANYWQEDGSALRQALLFANSLLGRSLLLFVLTVLALVVTRQSWRSSPLAYGYLIGFVLYAVKLFAFSSWVIWVWYAFPVIIGLFVLFQVIDQRLVTAPIALGPRLEIAAAGLLAALIASTPIYRDDPHFQDINLAAVSALGPVFNGERVAMGDRAGSFAAHYPGPVTQLEGLVNDKAYLDALRQHQDIKPLLCSRGVRFVLSYQRDLGPYETITFDILRRTLTAFPSPTLTVSRADEAGRVFDLALYDNAAFDEGDNYLYAWRLSGCPDTRDQTASVN
jgi:hypothetical protein